MVLVILFKWASRFIGQHYPISLVVSRRVWDSNWTRPGLSTVLYSRGINCHCTFISDSCCQCCGYSSVVEHLTADQEFPSSNLSVPKTFFESFFPVFLDCTCAFVTDSFVFSTVVHKAQCVCLAL